MLIFNVTFQESYRMNMVTINKYINSIIIYIFIVYQNNSTYHES